ncbi:DUF6020 family protein [Ruminococcus flavefaciens]|uniref:Glycosyltransferase RgtA/B/C/D-like domain-containing protein n=2 Tax=Ruminococcus flavefaciens TaxID=1265 RepID=W7V1Q8_RUMFL|nr:DUF6020 family protein [Ruminococcus flavefaciens]EWM54697.1 hypothetical protein RF007C_02135 [Ruminococcus flavefaciens 007c]
MKNQNSPKTLADLKWLPYLLSALGAVAFSQYFCLKSSSHFTLLFALLMFPLFRKRYSRGNGFTKSSAICGALFSLFTIGSALIGQEQIQPTFSKLEQFSPFIATFIMFFFFYEALCFVLLQKLETITLTADRAEPSAQSKLKVFFGSMAVMLIMWLPFLLYSYPAVMTEDSIWQLQQAAGLKPLNNHHPVFHTLIIRLTFNIGKLIFGDDTRAVLVCTVTQQLFLSACFAYLIETLYKFKAKKCLIIGSLLFYCIPVYHGMYSVTMWKDVWFGGIIAVMSALIWRLLCKEKKFRLSAAEAVILFVFSVAMCLMRSNGLYAYPLLLIGSIFVFFRRSKLTIAVMAASLAAAVIINGPVYKAMNVEPGDVIDPLSIPDQQIAAVAANPNNLTPEQKELLSKVIEIDKIDDMYTYFISNPIHDLIREKNNQQYIAEHKSEFLKLWADLGMAYPEKYFRAYINQTSGYWFPDIQYWVTSTSCFTEGFDIKPESKAGFMTDTLTFYINSYIETPFLGLVWSIGMGVWVFLFMTGAAMRRHRRSVFLVYLPVMAIWLTLLAATPVHAEFRYIYCLFTAMPLFCAIPCMDTKICAEASEVKEKISENTDVKVTAEVHDDTDEAEEVAKELTDHPESTEQ